MHVLCTACVQCCSASPPHCLPTPTPPLAVYQPPPLPSLSTNPLPSPHCLPTPTPPLTVYQPPPLPSLSTNPLPSPPQLCITASQIQWTADCEKALDRGDKKALRSLKKKQVAMLDKFSEAVRGKLSKMERAKIVALITIEVHARDIIDKLFRMGCNTRNAFEWLSQLRFYWEDDDCCVRQTNTCFEYAYEYLGNSGRLVITPLTDRLVQWCGRGGEGRVRGMGLSCPVPPNACPIPPGHSGLCKASLSLSAAPNPVLGAT